MNTLRQAVQEYLSLHRSLGFKLQDAGKGLIDFVTFMERHRVPPQLEMERAFVR